MSLESEFLEPGTSLEIFGFLKKLLQNYSNIHAILLHAHF